MDVDLLIKENKELMEEKQRYKEMWFTANNALAKYRAIEEQIGCPLEVREKALNGFYISGYGYVARDDDFIYLGKDDKGYYLKVVIHPSKPTPPNFYGYCDIHYLKDYKITWWLKETREE